MPKVLEGIRVIDWSIYQVGPFAAAMLADLGAEVIHIEELGKGDRLRGLKRFLGLEVNLPQGRHIHFEEHNRNKKSLAIDLKKPQAKGIMYRLIENSDVFLTNLRPKTVKAMGLDYETLRKRHPKLIYAWASGLGFKGPDSQLPSIDIIGCGRSGIMMSCSAGVDTPVLMAPGIGDRIASIHLAYGVLAALLARERFGIGQEVRTSQLGSLIALQGFSLMPVLLLKKEYPSFDRNSPRNPLYNYYRCKDRKWIVLGMIEERHWAPFCSAIGKPELINDPRFVTEELRSHYSKELVAILDRVFSTKTLKEWADIFKAKDLLFSPVNTPTDVVADAQVLINKYITEWEHPILGKIQFVGFPIELGETPLTLEQPAPECGQHTEEILIEVCKYSWERIQQFKEEGVI
jgi:crotonobetainyl-CoA:carnitine CoA-transferase CaiB-like acyl-CoA transferase